MAGASGTRVSRPVADIQDSTKIKQATENGCRLYTYKKEQSPMYKWDQSSIKNRVNTKVRDVIIPGGSTVQRCFMNQNRTAPNEGQERSLPTRTEHQIEHSKQSDGNQDS